MRQQARTSGAGALKPYKYRKVHHYTMGTSAQNIKISKSDWRPGALSGHLRIILGAPLPYYAFWTYMSVCNKLY